MPQFLNFSIILFLKTRMLKLIVSVPFVSTGPVSLSLPISPLRLNPVVVLYSKAMRSSLNVSLLSKGTTIFNSCDTGFFLSFILSKVIARVFPLWLFNLKAIEIFTLLASAFSFVESLMEISGSAVCENSVSGVIFLATLPDMLSGVTCTGTGPVSVENIISLLTSFTKERGFEDAEETAATEQIRKINNSFFKFRQIIFI